LQQHPWVGRRVQPSHLSNSSLRETQRGREPEGTNMSTLRHPRVWIEPVSARQDYDEGGAREGHKVAPIRQMCGNPSSGRYRGPAVANPV
jgi:hypothetical protein